MPNLNGPETQNISKIPKLSLSATQIGEARYRIDVDFENIPKDFLGTAFNLTTNNDWQYKNFVLGEIFQNPKNAIALITSHSDPKRKIIFGVTLKRGSSIFAEKGKLASFEFEVPHFEKTAITFEKGVVSILKEKRTDVAEVIWENAIFDFSQTSSENNNELLKATVLSSNQTSKPFNTETQAHTSQLAENQNTPTIQPFSENKNDQLWIWFFVFAIIFTASILLLMRKRFIQTKYDKLHS